MLDYIIVGSGLAGIAFAEKALENKKSILVFDNNSQNSSTVAGGLYNPVILKRFSEVWNAKEQVALADVFYPKIEKKLNQKLDFKMPVLRKFFSAEEQNNWFIAADKPNLTPFLSVNLVSKSYEGIDSPFGFGEVLYTGYVDTAKLLSSYRNYLIDNQLFAEETFDYSQFQMESEFVSYKNIKARHIVFAEGFGLHANPFFNTLPLDGTKGELFIIKAPNLKLDAIVNASVFILPFGEDLFKVGATYNWEDKTAIPTEAGKLELLEKLKELLQCDFEIVEHLAGVRPTVKDRRPLVGTHPNHKNIHILNGLGTRGVMLAPAMAKALFENIENNIPLDPYIDCNRFYKK